MLQFHMYVGITNHGQKKSNRHTPAQTKKAKQKRKATDRRREELTGQQKRRKKQKKKIEKKICLFFCNFSADQICVFSIQFYIKLIFI
jgi:3'-phosphoadenosine 5'-phosphosulfate (PAPS) 3'-phosphatase